MFIYNEDTHIINYIRGDTAHFRIAVSPFKPEEGDVLNFTVKKRDGEPAILKLTADNDMNFTINSEDTVDAVPGRYLYDIQLTTGIGEVYTLIGPAAFIMDVDITTPEEE